MDKIIRMTIFKDVKDRHAICLKFGYRFFTSMTMFLLQAKGSFRSTIKENQPLHCRTFLAFVIVLII